MTDATSQITYKVTHVLPDQERIIARSFWQGDWFGEQAIFEFADVSIDGVAIEVDDIIRMTVHVPSGGTPSTTTYTLEKSKKPVPAITNVQHLGSFAIPEGTKSIFTVTCIRRKEHEKRRASDIRCWGWYSNLDDAKAVVLSNATDMFECHFYDYAVIEEYKEGICQIVKNEWWFYADYEKADRSGGLPMPVVTEVPKPACFEHVVHFGMG